jgi:hypothetical protein
MTHHAALMLARADEVGGCLAAIAHGRLWHIASQGVCGGWSTLVLACPIGLMLAVRNMKSPEFLTTSSMRYRSRESIA